MDGLHINSGSVLINTKRYGQRKHNHDLPNSGSFECSKQSILSSMDKFVRTVQNMRGTILVPSRLRDMRLRQRLPECELANLVAQSNGSKISTFNGAGQLKKNSTSILNSNSTKHKYNSHFHSSHYHLLHNHLQDYHLGYHLHSALPSSSTSLDLENGCFNRLNYDPTEMPSALMNADLFNFYSMLYDVKQQLLWGPASGQSTIFTNYNTNSDLNQSTLNQLNSTMANCNLNNNSDQTPLTPLNHHQTQCNLNKDNRAESTCSSGYSSNSSTRNSTTNLSFIAQSPSIQQHNCNLSQSTSSSTNSLSNTPLTTRSSSSSQDDVKLNMNNRLNDSTSSNASTASDIGSTDGNSKLVVDSPQSKTPQSDSDLESELESDSILTDRTSEQITDQTQLLASAFRHHLQALHTILDQLTHSAEYLSRNYELDLNETNN